MAAVSDLVNLCVACCSLESGCVLLVVAESAYCGVARQEFGRAVFKLNLYAVLADLFNLGVNVALNACLFNHVHHLHTVCAACLVCETFQHIDNDYLVAGLCQVESGLGSYESAAYHYNLVADLIRIPVNVERRDGVLDALDRDVLLGRADCEDECVRSDLLNKFRSNKSVQTHVDIPDAYLVNKGVLELGNVALVNVDVGEEERAAEFVFLFS